MRCALAALGFINCDLQHNLQVILDTMEKCAKKADIVIFGEAFLQGFYAADFDIRHDTPIAVAADDPIIKRIRAKARECGIGVSFGFIEKEADIFYSSQLTVDPDGEIIDLYRRISPGWKLPHADHHYREGDSFHIFYFMSKKIAVALCGDLWYDNNADAMRNLCPDVVFWPVYTDFNWEKWNADIKHEYAAQAQKACDRVLYVNAYCKDKEGKEISRGGAALFENGLIIREIPSGKEDILIVEI